MQYETWRDDIFNLPDDTDPILADLPSDSHELEPERALDFIDRCFVDPDIHERYTPEQIGIGLNILFNECRESGRWYSECQDVPRVMKSTHQLLQLYRKIFDRYCADRHGESPSPGHLGYICYMFWENFSPIGGDTPRPIEDAALGVMHQALQSSVQGSLESAIHGLGHAVDYRPDAATILRDWLRKPTTDDPGLLRYAKWAVTGQIN